MSWNSSNQRMFNTGEFIKNSAGEFVMRRKWLSKTRWVPEKIPIYRTFKNSKKWDEK